jgi:SAM-dependent methyltransferase
MSSLQKWLRKRFKGVSWRNHYLNFVFHGIDIPDLMVRQINELDHLPKYSVRIRSNGINSQFGGKQFAQTGKFIAQLLIDHALLVPESKVIEIGCGCGRTALALTQILHDGNYIGMDIDEKSIRACRENQLIKGKKFRFDWMNIYHPEYNPQGKVSAKSYKLPYPDQSAEIIFLISVFTHMLSDEVSHYISEINRILCPGGRCLFTTFIMDYGQEGKLIDFPYEHGYYRLHQESIPEKAVGYYRNFFEEAFASVGMSLLETPLLGHWRSSSVEEPFIPFGQDVMIFTKGEVAQASESDSLHAFQ